MEILESLESEIGCCKAY